MKYLVILDSEIDYFDLVNKELCVDGWICLPNFVELHPEIEGAIRSIAGMEPKK